LVGQLVGTGSNRGFSGGSLPISLYTVQYSVRRAGRFSSSAALVFMSNSTVRNAPNPAVVRGEGKQQTRNKKNKSFLFPVGHNTGSHGAAGGVLTYSSKNLDAGYLPLGGGGSMKEKTRKIIMVTSSLKVPPYEIGTGHA
jgi:hypothetical protein